VFHTTHDFSLLLGDGSARVPVPAVPVDPTTLVLPSVLWRADFGLSVENPSLVGVGAAPDLPAISGMSLVFDIDFGGASAGAFPAQVDTRAGTATTARAVAGGGAPTIVTVTGARRGAYCDGVDDWISIQNVLASLLPVNPDPEFVLGVIGRVPDFTSGKFFCDITRGNQSGAATLNRYLLNTSSNASAAWQRANGSNVASATIAAASSLAVNTTLRMICRGSLNGDQINRGMVNGGAKASSAARSVTSSGGSWSRMAIGAQMVNTDGTTMSNFRELIVERIFGYYADTPNSATDAALDSVEAALASYYA
jgi:hypothetical protein